MSSADAAKLFGAALWRAIRDTDHGLKDLGDAAQVGRICKGIEVPPWLTKALQQPAMRNELIVSLAELAGIPVQTTIVLPYRRRA